jgi:hypothetical protein
LQQLSHVVTFTLTGPLHDHAHELSLVGLDLLQQGGILAAELLYRSIAAAATQDPASE